VRRRRRVDTPAIDRIPQAPVVPAGASLAESSVRFLETTPLSQAMANWLLGDWHPLADLADEQVARHPERDRLALLVACANQQLDRHELARHFTRRAIGWGCPPGLVAKLLVSGVHNTLGRIAALRQDEPALERHFGDALRVTGDPQAPSAAHARAVREMARLGLLPQALGLVQQHSEALDDPGARPVALASQVRMLRSEVELLQHELSLALQRHVSTLAGAGAAATTNPAQPAPVATPDLAELRRLSTAQLGQDLWVLERSGFQRAGFFVEFGATDGIRLSNTYLLEQAFGWSGICLEPNPRLYEQLQSNRRCTVADLCIGAHSGETVDFVLAEEYGGMVKDMARDVHAQRRAAYWADPGNRITLQTICLHDALVQLGAPRRIDYLSIDTEGSEYDILSTFPFEQWDVRRLTVEHNHSADRERIHQLLTERGYLRTEAQWDDWYERADSPTPPA
jgi:FkbM family methyltransferase